MTNWMQAASEPVHKYEKPINQNIRFHYSKRKKKTKSKCSKQLSHHLNKLKQNLHLNPLVVKKQFLRAIKLYFRKL